jgi:RimJ/RimL family protein N-acetyltransferase
MAGDIRLRDVEDGDLDALYEYQQEPESSAMAAVPSRERQAFMEHVARVRSNESNVYKAIVVDGQVVGALNCFGEPQGREVGYRIGRAYWGQGIATRALALFLAQMPERPLHATVAQHNPASRRVLEKCGFVLAGEAVEGDGVAVFYFTLG